MSRQAHLNNSTALSLIACFDPIYLGVIRLCAANLLEILIKSVRASIDSKLTIVMASIYTLFTISLVVRMIVTAVGLREYGIKMGSIAGEMWWAIGISHALIFALTCKGGISL
jgi:hypothetical protein